MNRSTSTSEADIPTTPGDSDAHEAHARHDDDSMASARSTARVMAAVRIMTGVLWLTNVNWKGPNFGDGTDGGLYGFTKHAVDNPVVQPFSWLVEHVVLPNFVPFGYGVLIIESLLGACLLVGIGTRFWGVVGFVQAAAIWMSVGHAPHEWPWAYYMMMAINLALCATAAGRTWGLDGLARQAWRARDGPIARLLLRVS